MQTSLFKKFGLFSAAASILLLVACSNQEASEAKTSSEASSSKVVASSSTKAKKSSSSSKVKATDDDDDDDLDTDTDDDQDDVDVSDIKDPEIEGIETHGDYLAMYFKIMDDFANRYDAAVKGTPAEGSASYIKDANKQGYDAAEKSLAGMKDKKLTSTEKKDYIKKLKEFKKSMNEALESVENSFN